MRGKAAIQSFVTLVVVGAIGGFLPWFNCTAASSSNSSTEMWPKDAGPGTLEWAKWRPSADWFPIETL